MGSPRSSIAANVAVVAIAVVGCAGPDRASGRAKDVVAAAASARVADVAEPVSEPEPEDAPPATWADALERYRSDCPAPFFSLGAADEVDVGNARFARSGSTMRMLSPTPVPKRLVIGAVGAIKDADPGTRENLVKAASIFQARGVTLVLVPGDIVGNETAELRPVTQMLDDVFEVPVLVHSGNYEWTSAVSEVVAEHAGLINGNIVRDVDVGGVHVLSLPGYFNRRFLQGGACHYDPDDVSALGEYAKALRERGDVVVVSSHGPPLGKVKADAKVVVGKKGWVPSLDQTSDGEHVGDPDLNAMISSADVRVGIFSHILEAGGAVVADVDSQTPIALPMKAQAERVFVNVGSASAFGWGMNDGSTGHGLAAVVTVDKGGAQVELLKLR